MSGIKREKSDPGDDSLKNIIRELEKGVSDIEQRMEADTSLSGNKVGAGSVTDLTSMKEEVKQWVTIKE